MKTTHRSLISFRNYNLKLLIILHFFWSCYLMAQTNNALHFDGSNDFVSVPSTTQNNLGDGDYTIELWVKSSFSGLGVIIGKHGGAGFWLGFNSGKISMSINGGVITSTANVNDNNWKHVAVRRQGSTTSIFIDGELDSSFGSLNGNPANGEPLTIGNFIGSFHFLGSVDDVRIWNVARTDIQILNNKDAELTGNESGLGMYFKFNEGVAETSNTGVTTAINSAGNGDGTLNNFALTGDVSNWITGVVVSGNFSDNANLASLSLSTGTLLPSFSSTQLNYTAEVSSSTSSLTIIPVTEDQNAIITINGTITTSGNSSVPVNLAYGPNTVTVNVTAQSGNNSKFYIIEITRATVTPTVSSFTPSSGCAGETTVTINGTNFGSSAPFSSSDTNLKLWIDATNFSATNGGSLSGIITDASSNNWALTTTAVYETNVMNGKPVVRYNNNASTRLNTPFVSTANTYLFMSVELVAFGSTWGSIFSHAPHDNGFQLEQNGTKANNVYHWQTANDNTNVDQTITYGTQYVIAVKLENGNQRTFTLFKKDDNGNLENLGTESSSCCSFTPGSNYISIGNNGFGGEWVNMRMGEFIYFQNSLPTSEANIVNYLSDKWLGTTINGDLPEITNVSVGGNSAVSYSVDSSTQITAVFGSGSTGAVSVTNAFGTGTSDASFSEVDCTNANLSALSLSSGNLTPSFDSSILNYSVDVLESVNSIVVTVTTDDSNATISINGTEAISNEESQPINLFIGLNTISIVVTAQDGTTIKTYTIQVNRQGEVLAAGGDITYSGEYTIHTFKDTGASNFYSPITTNVEVLVIAGGGSGGGTSGPSGGGHFNGGGGGAGGLLASNAYSVAAGIPIPVTVGEGGASVTVGSGNNGSNSSFGDIITIGGGGGGAYGSPGKNGGSGGGSGRDNGTFGIGIAGQGNNGGTGDSGGGGGAGASGTADSGGVGVESSITGIPTYYAGGGGSSTTGFPGGIGGLGGGGNGVNSFNHPQFTAGSGTPNTGGGGGGAGVGYPTGAGGSGVVIVKYLTGSSISKVDAANLSISSGALVPAFSTNTLNYTTNGVSTSTSSVFITLSVNDPSNILEVRVNNNNFSTISNGLPSTPIDLEFGDNIIEARVRATDGTTKSYRIAINRETPQASHLSFDGDNDFVNLGGNINIANSSFTLETWFKSTPGGNNGRHRLITIGTGGAFSYSATGINIDSNGLIEYFFYGDDASYQTNNVYGDNTWHHIAFSFNSTTKLGELYLDGIKVSQKTFGSNANLIGNNLARISGAVWANTEYFKGDIDEVRIWNTPRTASQIFANKNCELQGNETGLLAYYRFNQGLSMSDNSSIVSLIDATSNNNNAALLNFALNGSTSNWVSGSPIINGVGVPSSPSVNFEQQFFLYDAIASNLIPPPSDSIVWFNDNSTTPITASSVLLSGVYYVAEVNSNGCQSMPIQVTVTVDPVTPPTAESIQSFCEGALVSELIAQGSNLNWFLTESGGVPLANNDILESSSYYVSQTINGFESNRTLVEVLVNSLPTVPSVNSLNYFAHGQTLANINVQGSNLAWYDAATGGNILPSSTALVDGVAYYVSQTVNGCESNRVAVEAIESFVQPSALRPDFCDTTFSSLSSALFAITVSGSSLYEFEVTNTVTNTVELISSTNRFFRISDLADGGSYNTVYSIRVRVVNGGQIGPFGSVCSVTIVPQPIKLRDISCGVQMSNLGSILYGESFAGAELFEFEITNMTTNQVSFVVSASRNFTLAQMTDQTPTLFTEYQVRMRAWIGGVPVVAFGPVCSVFSPVNHTQLRPSSCDAALPNRFTPIFANSVAGATSYEFEVTDTVTNEVESIVRDVRNFHLGLLEMEIAFNRVYAIRVRVVVDGQQMPYSTVCNVTTPIDPNAVSRGNTLTDNSFKTYPNPFNTQTTISWTKVEATQAHISVYDVTGKLIQTLTTNESSIQLGQDYTAGMYFVTIVDGEQQFQTKIVKK